MKIICIGRNYVEHARELNNPLPEKPVFFLKPNTALIIRNRPFFYPDFSEDIHYEVELVIKISRNGRSIQEKYAPGYYEQVGLGIDFTARDLQSDAKSRGLPWEVAKAFDGSAPVSRFIPLNELKDRQNIRFRLDINEKTVQEGESNLMIFPVDRVISYVSQFITLKMGDLIFTGTPKGVGPVKIGDHLTGYIEDRKMLDFRVK
jgi:2-keto-4-pentenoate hydratase/2-oxohepta-3-ene-1,7-dioic acid hydratase in catechol pathway